ncbi:carbonic anhydrase 5B, mitochondrial-like [Delphinus delphis]|uniref:carbonic anhydrase 5B, mitochondrial-like n=1 Tax=Delphinus delphis TaxID=9728 RepID=UPI0028C48475|nr:carbonic anhydrase 5B, mitochondrial-like [Delphinus delphis]
MGSLLLSSILVPASYLGADQDFKLKMVMMSRLRVILQASPCKAQWRRFQIPRSMLARPFSLYTCTYRTWNRALHPLWESVDLVPGGECQSPINDRWRDSVYDPGLEPLTVSYDPTTCLRVWNNGYSFLVELEDSADNSGESQTCLWAHLELKGQFHQLTNPGRGDPSSISKASDIKASNIETGKHSYCTEAPQDSGA